MFRNLFPVLFDDDESGIGGGAVTETAPPTADIPDSPWAGDLRGLGLEGEALTRADAYMRGTIQPRMTQFEQQLAEAKDARELWKDFHDDPSGTFLAVGSQLFGEDKATELQKLIAAQEEAEAAQPTTAIDPRLEALLAEHEASKQAEAYSAQLAKVQEANPDLDTDLFHPFVIAAEGDFPAAVERYNRYVETVQSKYAPAIPDVPDAPATLGLSTDGAQAITPPVTEKYDSLDAALDATLAEMKATPAPAVGTV